MEFDEYQRLTEITDVRPDLQDVGFPLLGLAGEVGSLVAEYKKRLRAGASYEGFEEEVREELGDLLWYAATLARTLGLSLDDIATANLHKTALAWGDKLPLPPGYDAEFPPEQRLPRQFTVRFAVHERDGVPHVAMYLGTDTVGDPLDDNAYPMVAASSRSHSGPSSPMALLSDPIRACLLVRWKRTSQDAGSACCPRSCWSRQPSE